MTDGDFSGAGGIWDAFDDRHELFQDIVDEIRLVNAVFYAGAKVPPSIPALDNACDHDIHRRVLFLKFGNDVHPGHLGQAKIEQHDVDLGLVQVCRHRAPLHRPWRSRLDSPLAAKASSKGEPAALRLPPRERF